MDPKAVKEWAAEYRRSNKADDKRRKERLLLETIEESVRSYSAMCELAIAFSGSLDEPEELQYVRHKHYADLMNKWAQLKERLSHGV